MRVSPMLRGWTPWLVAATLTACEQQPRAASPIGVVAADFVGAGDHAETGASRPIAAGATRVFDRDDDAIRASLAESPIAWVKLGRGGRSIGFKIRLRDGTTGYFKPEQTFAAHWYGELAAYYVDRALGLGRVPPAIGRRVPFEELRAATQGSPHADELVVQEDGTVRGAFVAWVPGRLVRFDPPDGWEAWLSIEPPPEVSPFQRASDYRRAVRRAKARPEPRRTGPVPRPARADRPAELSDLILFDVLIGNHDRWGGNFTNVRTLGKHGPLVVLDNAGGFHRNRKPDARMRAQLRAVQRMRETTVVALRDLKLEDLRRALAGDPLAPVLTDAHLAQLEERRQLILEHATRTQQRFGDSATPW